MITNIKQIPIELLIWPLGLAALYFMDPHGGGASFCLLKRVGISWCPGCWLGHSIHYLLHGQWVASIRSHPLGFFAVAVLGHRVISLARLQSQAFHHHKKKLHE